MGGGERQTEKERQSARGFVKQPTRLSAPGTRSGTWAATEHTGPAASLKISHSSLQFKSSFLEKL